MADKFHFLLLLVLVLFIAPFVKSFSFRKTRFELEDTSIIYEGGANPLVGGIKLNSDTFQCQSGHATYAQKIRIWDSNTNKLTNFSTLFSSIVDIQRRQVNQYGSGFAFFLAPLDYRIPLNSAGGFLGLYNITTKNSSWPPSQIVHIEFDSVSDPEWDPPFQHVAINVNSLSSVTYTPWNTSLHSGDASVVSVTYDSTTMNLTVSWNYQTTGSNSNEITSLSHRIDLREVLPEWVSIGFSGSTRDYIEDHTILSWDFSSSLDTDEPSNNRNMHTKLLMLETIPPAGFLILIVVVAFSILWMRKLMRAKAEKTNLEYMKFDIQKGSGPRRISYADLVLATRDFSSDNKLGKEGFGGAMYKGYFPHLSITVAVKKIKCCSKEGKKELIKEAEIISKLRHPNLVRLVGWCQEKDEFFLVYEFLPKGSLDSYLFRNMAPPLAWDVRFKIATGLASALRYLHEEREQRVEHKDVKSSNTMLDSDFNVKLGDFGLAETVGLAEKFGHLPSEYGKTFSYGSDVNSFGLVALELCTGKMAMDLIGPESEMNMVEWVWKLYGDGKLSLAADKKLAGMGFDEKQMKCLLIVGIWCSHPDKEVRPSISQVIHVLNFDAVLPNLSTHSQSRPSNSYCDGETLTCSSLEEQETFL